MYAQSLVDAKAVESQEASVIGSRTLCMDLQNISAQWESFGLNVGVSMDQMKRIREEVSGREGLVNYCFNRVIAAWLDGKKSMVNKEVLVEAVKSMDGSLAEKLVGNKDLKLNYRLVNVLKPLKSRYSVLGVHLGVSPTVIREFEAHRGDTQRCLNDTIDLWFTLGGDDTPSKELLSEALTSMGKIGLAETLTEKYKDKTFPGEDAPPVIN